MGMLTNQKQDNAKIYDMILNDAQSKVLRITNRLNIDKFVFERRTRSFITFYDTADHLLTNTGILIYKVYENGEYFFKIEKLNFLPNVSRLSASPVFEHKCEARDTPFSQAFYLISGITTFFSTQFNIDLENILKFAYPMLHVDIQGSVFKGFNGNGFKCSVEFQNVLYTNYITRKKYENNELTVYNVSSKTYQADFDNFISLLERYGKVLLPKNDTRYEFGNRVTQIFPKVKKDKKGKKNKKPEKPAE